MDMNLVQNNVNNNMFKIQSTNVIYRIQKYTTVDPSFHCLKTDLQGSTCLKHGHVNEITNQICHICYVFRGDNECFWFFFMVFTCCNVMLLAS